MTKKIYFILLIILLSCSFKPDYSHIKVIEVIDGDTIKLADGTKLRYIGIDTPELTRKTIDGFEYSPQPFAQEAKEYNRQLVENKYIKVEFDIEKFDNYGRLLGYCFVDDIFVNAKLIEDGFAVVYTKPPNLKYTELFVKLQKEAQNNKRGLWGAYQVIEYNKAVDYIGQIRTVRGKILATHKSKNCVFLNFGPNYKEDFTIVIFNNSLKFFYEKGINPLQFYKNKIVEVTGRIKNYNGPEIVVNLPEEIVVIE